MNYVYAALLLHSAGKTVDENGVTSVVNATGEQADPALVKALTTALEGVDIKEAISKAAMPVAAAAPAAGGEPAAAKDEKKEEEAEKKKEEAVEGLGSLFG